MEFRRRYYNLRKGEASTEENYDDLLVFGYPCTVFRDDERATWVESGEHLIISPNDSELTIDRFSALFGFYFTNRLNKNFYKFKGGVSGYNFMQILYRKYDCRLLLTNPKNYENGHSSGSPTEEEIAEQILCDEERYRDLKDNQTENGAEAESTSAKTTSAVPFDYKTDEAAGKSEMQNDESSDDEDEFSPSADLKIPPNMIIPSSSSQNLVIEKTAAFVASQGPQMEIIINAKQKANKRFRFLDYENPLHKYYKHVLKMIKEKKYSPQISAQPVRKSVRTYSDHADSNDSDDDGNYLHPSLMAKPKSATASPSTWPVEPSTYKIGEESDSYSELYNRLAVYLPKREEIQSPIETNSAQNNLQEESSSDAFQMKPAEAGRDFQDYVVAGAVVPPPPDLQPIIDRLAEYVARNGVDFETVVRARHDSRFHFVEQSSVYFPYYCSKITWYQYEHYMSNYYHGGGGLTDFTGAQTHAVSESRLVENASQKSAKPLIDHPWCTGGTASDIASATVSQKASIQPKPFTKSQGIISFSLKSKEKQESKNRNAGSNEEFESDNCTKVVSPESNVDNDLQGAEFTEMIVKQPVTDLDNEAQQVSDSSLIGVETDFCKKESSPVTIFDCGANNEEIIEPCDFLESESSNQSTSTTSLQNQRRMKARLFLDSLKRSKEKPLGEVKQDEEIENSCKRRRRRSKSNS